MTNLIRSRRFTLAILLGLACFSGCANGLTGGRSMFATVPGTGGDASDEEIIARSNRDPWQPGSPFTVNTGPQVSVR